MMVSRRAILGALFVVGFVAGITGTALAYPKHTTCAPDGDPTVSYFFDDSGDEAWRTNRKNQFTAGATKWEAPVDPYDGDAFVTIEEDTSYPAGVGAIQVLVVNLGNGIGGEFDCPSGRDRIRMDLIDAYEDITWQKVVGIAAHEMGHALNMKHTGDLDSWDVITTDSSGYEYPNEEPTMGCGPGVHFWAQRSLEQDDWAFLEFNFTSYDNGHANTSFENPTWPKRFWEKSLGTSLRIETTGSADGVRHALFGGEWGATMWQTVRISDPAYLTGRVNFRQTQSGTAGHIYYSLWGREIEYPPDTGVEYCRFREDWNLSDPDTSGLLVLAVGRWGTPTSSWQWPDTPEWTAVDDWQGVDVRLKITNYVTEDGNPDNPVDVRIDHARVRHTT